MSNPRVVDRSRFQVNLNSFKFIISVIIPNHISFPDNVLKFSDYYTNNCKRDNVTRTVGTFRSIGT